MRKALKALKRSEKLVSAIEIYLTILFLCTASFAQQRQPDRGFQAGNSYAVSDIETINTTNGNLMLSIPLASLPAGRGTSPGFTVSLNYNSKLYDAKQELRTDGTGSGQNISGNPEQSNYFVEMLSPTDEGGWHLSVAHRLKLTLRGETEAPVPCSSSYYLQKNAYIYKLNLQTPGGGSIEFKPIGYTEYYGDGYFNVSPLGVLGVYTYGSIGDGTGACNYINTQVSTTGMNYAANDGSGARLFIPNQQNQAAEGLRWTLYYPDGKTIEHFPADDSNIIERITDRNGNRVVLKSSTFNGSRALKIEDDAGRFIALQGNTVYSQGANGEMLPTVIAWKDIFAYRRYKATYAPNANPDQREQNLLANFYAVESITLPPQAGSRKYEFTYNAIDTYPTEGNYTQGWGELNSVKMPGGAKADYQFSVYNSQILDVNFDVLRSYVTAKTLTYKENYDGAETTKTDSWQYALSQTGFSATAPDGSVSSQFFENPWTNITWKSGLVYSANQSDGSSVEKIWLDKTHVKTEFSTVANAQGQQSLTAIKDYAYDANGNITNIKEYDFVAYGSLSRDGNGQLIIPANAPLKRQTINEYYNPTVSNFDTSLKLKGLLKSTEVRSGVGTTVSRSEFLYDDANNKGNLTETRVWDSSKGALNSPDASGSHLTASNSISTTAQYNSYGSPISTTDAKGNQTQISYGAVSGPNGTISDLYPTQIISAYGTAIQQTVQSEYDFSTGLVKKTTALGNTAAENVSAETVYDALGRPLISKAATGTAKEIWTQVEYDDSNRRVITKSDLYAKGDGKKVSTQFYDQLGRVRLTKTLEDSATQSATNETDGIKVQTRYSTGNPYSYQLSSNPYRAATSTAATNEPSMGWTRSKSINTGKHSEVETFAGAALPAPWGTNTSSSGVVSTDADADRMLVTDQAGKRRISQSNALGQLINVWEVKGSDSDTEAISFGSPALSLNALKTSYQYDTLNNLTVVNQGAQTRTFSYSSLSRLKSANNPESGTISYAYDNNGNLTQKTDARSVSTAYIYDALNRVTNRNYTAPTGLVNYQAAPNVAYIYDAAGVSFSKGKLTEVDNGVSKTKYTSFDVMGRVTGSEQITPGVSIGAQTYVYNLSGALIEEKYPSGRVVKNVLDSNGDLQLVQSKKNQASGFWSYAKSFTYTAAGAVSSMQLGNGRWESTQFNSRLQPTQIALGSVQSGTDNLKLNFTYSSTPTSADNNGNVLSQTTTVPTETRNGNTYAAFTATQNYSYDSLNRLKSAQETIPNQTGWKQTFKYDRYGNRNFDTTNVGDTTTIDPNCATAVCNPTVDPATNKLVGYQFDSSGNTKTDAAGRSFTYDGENKQVKVMNGTAVIGEYFYDGDGKRVKKYVPSSGETTIFVYDAGGQLVAEYSTQIATTPQVSYLTQDNLGSPRINTDANGAVISRHDYMPFGEEIGRASYGGDSLRKQFTSYERDTETDLDYAKARYYAKNHGRFTTTDPLLASAKPVAPQTWNRFAYVMNNPLKYVDPSGLCSVPSGLKAGQVGICVEAFIAAKRIDTFGHGDNRTHEPNNPDATARMRINMIVSATDTTINSDVQERLISSSSASVPAWRNSDGVISELDIPPLAATGDITSSTSSTVPQGTEGFGDGRNSSTTLNIGLRNGANGAQVLGNELQAAAAVQGNTPAGVATAIAGGIVQAAAPPGTIDVNAQIRITGSGSNIRVSGTAQSRPFPSVTGWAYTVNADGSIKTTQLFRQNETKPSELTKPMRPIQ